MVSFGRGLAAEVGGQRGRSARGIPAGARRRGPRGPRSALPGLPPREGGAPAVAGRRGRKVSGAARAEGCASAECPRTGGDSRGAGAGGGEGRGWSGGGGAAVSGGARRCASGARRGEPSGTAPAGLSSRSPSGKALRGERWRGRWLAKSKEEQEKWPVGFQMSY